MGRSLLVLVSCCAAIALLLVAGPSSGETCVRSVDASAPVGASAEADLIAALSAADATACPGGWRVELSGTFPLTASLVWDDAIPLHLIGPVGATARLDGPGVTLSGASHRLLTVATASVVPVTLERLMLAGGDVEDVVAAFEHEGGAVLADDLRLIDVEMIGNVARMGGAVSTFDLTATRTSFVTNRADLGLGQGGAVYALGDVTLTNVTFAGNGAQTGGALFVDAALPPVAVTATNVTFRDNDATVATDANDLHLIASVPGDLLLTLRGVLLAGGASGPVCAFPNATPTTTVEETVARDASCGAVSGIIGALTFETVPFLPGTTPLPVPAGAWAGLDGIACDPVAGWPTTDQRGLARPQGATARCDIGAVERAYVAPAPPAPSAPASSDPDPDPDPAPVAGPVPTSIPAGGGACADGCSPTRTPVTLRAGAPAPPH